MCGDVSSSAGIVGWHVSIYVRQCSISATHSEQRRVIVLLGLLGEISHETQYVVTGWVPAGDEHQLTYCREWSQLTTSGEWLQPLGTCWERIAVHDFECPLPGLWPCQQNQLLVVDG